MRAWMWLLLAGCGADEPAGAVRSPPVASADEPVAFAPAPAAMQRLTDAQWRASVESLTAVAFTGDLPPDYTLHGFDAVGARDVTIAPLDLELYEAAAWEVAEAWMPDAATRDATVGCPLTPPLGEEEGSAALDVAACLEAWLVPLLREAWRRPPTALEVDALVGLFEQLDAELADPTLAAQAVAAAVLLSPHFLFAVEVGVSDPDDPSRRALTDHELAVRLAFALTGRPPDPALSQAADLGQLADPALLHVHGARLIDDGLARETLTDFFAEVLELEDLGKQAKDHDLYPGFDDALVRAMEAEVRSVFADVAIDQGADLRELFTTDITYVTPELAALYGLSAPSSPDGRASLPADQRRGGLLGRAAFLATQAHPTLTSPTQRGKYVRTRLLCQDIPAPPQGVITSLEAYGAQGTTRDLLEHHMLDPTCSGCHELMDPVGFAFEHFDAIGQWRNLDNGLPIDDSTVLDGLPVVGAAEMGAAVADHPALPGCLVRNAYRYATGHLELASEVALVDATAVQAEAAGLAIDDVMLSVVDSAGFRTVAHPDAGSCTAPGAERACTTACGVGVEQCVGGAWTGCTALLPAPEQCDGVDQDCDGEVDEDLVQACDGGVSRCARGAWGECELPSIGRDETCNGEDDDDDGEVDEDLAVDVAQVGGLDIVGQEPACDLADPSSSSCAAAVHRLCASNGCAASGFGPVALDGADAAVTCLDDAAAEVLPTTYGVLSLAHEGCHAGAPYGPDCFAAVHRTCSSLGLTTGYGPVESAGEDVVIVCMPSADVIEMTYTELSTYDAGCDAVSRWGAPCDAAMHDACRGLGYASGVGPLEHADDVAYVACVGER